MSVEINRSEFEKVCKLYTASLNSNNDTNVSDTKKPPKPPQGCPTEFVSGGWKYFWNGARPYRTSAQKNLGLSGIRIQNSRRYSVTQAGFKKACSVAKKTGFNEITFKPTRR